MPPATAIAIKIWMRTGKYVSAYDVGMKADTRLAAEKFV
jgi:hypothetical protein